MTESNLVASEKFSLDGRTYEPGDPWTIPTGYTLDPSWDGLGLRFAYTEINRNVDPPLTIIRKIILPLRAL